ncbi:MAG: efflux RND transporter periplasmic adaptor subunit, partial [Saprospiraceae bacterium]
ILAPFDGILTQASVNEGGYVRAGASLGMLMNTSVYEMEAAVSVADLKYIKRGLSVKVVSDDSGKTWFGKVKRISDLVDATTQTAIVYIGLSGNGLREGQYLRAIINTPSSNKGMKISKDLLVDNTKIYIIENQKIKEKNIQILSIEGNEVIVKGLENGTQILAEPVSDAYDGMNVKTMNQ